MIKNSKRIVFKFGTNILRNENKDISLSHVYSFIEDISSLFNQGKEILIVTSGAVGLGAKKLNIDTSTSTTLKQAAASVGQPMLMGIWQDGFEKYGIKTAQILLTEDDFSNRKKYLSLRLTLHHLINHRVIPIISIPFSVNFSFKSLISLKSL